MTWTAPMTAVANSAFTAAIFNREIRDNLLCMAPAMASVPGSIFCPTGPNAIVERGIVGDTVLTAETTTSTAYAQLATDGPGVKMTTGQKVLIFASATISTSNANAGGAVSVDISGATSHPAAQTDGLWIDGIGATGQPETVSAFFEYTSLNPGANIFRLLYVALGATTATFSNRHIVVIGL